MHPISFRPPTADRRRTWRMASSAALSGLLFLAACTPGEPDPSESPTAEAPSTSHTTDAGTGAGGGEDAAGTATAEGGGTGEATDADPDAEELGYTTELVLSENQKEATAQAIAVLEEYIAVSNEVFGAGGEGVEKFDDVASDEVLLGSREDAQMLKDDEATMEGAIVQSIPLVRIVDLNRADDTFLPIVVAEACIDSSAWTFTNTESEKTEDSVFEYVMAEYDGAWFVSEQSLVDECEY
ncbi:hypothetical protein [Brevibacterium litoralis]|uniref:hypothetical protein n=1 Tax=Brevibacterium litoralis TaxID=3138935 RepID=UPI0032EBE878